VLVPIEEGTSGVIPYVSQGRSVLPVFTDELAFRRFRLAGGRCGIVRGKQLPKILSDNKLSGVLLDGAGPAPMYLSLQDLVLGTEGPATSTGRVEPVSRMSVGPIRGDLPDEDVLNSIRAVCRDENIESAFLYSAITSGTSVGRLTLGIVVPPALSEVSRGPLIKRIIASLEPALRPARIDIHFVDGDQAEIAASAPASADRRRGSTTLGTASTSPTTGSGPATSGVTPRVRPRLQLLGRGVVVLGGPDEHLCQLGLLELEPGRQLPLRDLVSLGR
jgi:hypothetical protein